MTDDKPRILVVDDNRSVRASVVRILSPEDYRVDEAESGIEGLSKFEDGQYALVMLDLRMPKLGGLTVLQHVRSRCPDIPVIVMTGFPSLANAKESIELGAFDFLLKPLDAPQVRSVVSRALASSSWTADRR